MHTQARKLPMIIQVSIYSQFSLISTFYCTAVDQQQSREALKMAQ